MKLKKVNKDRLIFILYNLAVVIVFLAVSEGILAFLLHHPSRIPGPFLKAFRAYYTEHVRSTIQMEPACARYDSQLFYTLRPGKSTFRNLEFKTDFQVNSQGVRDDEESLQNPEIIVLGDSFTMGWGVDQDSTFASLLEQKLGTKILNAGISSYGTVRELKLLNRFDQRAVKTLIIQYHESDLVENKSFAENGDSLIISTREKFEETSGRVRKRAGYYFGKHTALIAKFILKDKLGRLEEPVMTGAEDADLFLHTLEKLKPSDSLRVIVFELANYGHLKNRFPENLERVLETRNRNVTLKVLNVQKSLDSNDYFVLDNHMDASGHKKIADLLAATVRGMSPNQ